MVFRINIHNEIIWPIMGFLLLKYYGVTGQILFLISIAWLIYVSVRDNRLLITIPQIHGFLLYLTFAVVAIIVGFMTHEMRDVAKDIFYTFPTIIIMMVGYLYNKYDNGKSITKTLYLTGAIITALSFADLIMNLSSISDMGLMRTIMGKQVYETTLIFAIMFSEKIVSKKIIFSKVMDWIILVTMMLKGITSMGRTELIVTITLVAVILLLNIYISEYKYNATVTFIVIAVIMATVGITAYRVLPNSIKSQFIDKLEYSLEEVDSGGEYNSTTDAMQHWRAYEIECAQEQWKEYNIFYQIVGGGFGEYIKIGYVPHNFTDDMMKNNAIALLHNSYYSILVKGGLLGLIAMLWLYLSNATAVFRKRYKKYTFEMCALCATTIGVIIFTYVVRGIFSQSFIFTWPFIVGWINGKIRNSENEQIEVQENTAVN